MATHELTYKRGDMLPPLDANLVQDSANTPHDLTGATVVFILRNQKTGALKVNRGSCSIVDATLGQVRYTWQTTDLNIAGVYNGEFEVTFATGKPLSFPQEDYIEITIEKDLG